VRRTSSPRSMTLLASLLLAAAVTSACGSDEGEIDADAASADANDPRPFSFTVGDTLPTRLVFDFGVERRPDGAMVVKGETNLPDQVQLLIRLTSLTGRAEGLYLSEGFATVASGRFASSDFTNVDRAYPAGVYEVRVSARFTQSFQNERVLDIVGDGGSELRNVPSPYLKNRDPEVTDGRIELDRSKVFVFPEVTREVKVVQAVKDSIEKRTCTQSLPTARANQIASEMRGTRNWAVEARDDGQFSAVFSFDQGEAIWQVDLAKSEVSFANLNAKSLSCLGPALARRAEPVPLDPNAPKPEGADRSERGEKNDSALGALRR
jgi:hypothetical protein